LYGIPEKNVALSYIDNENDEIIMSTSEEFQHYLSSNTSEGKFIKFTIINDSEPCNTAASNSGADINVTELQEVIGILHKILTGSGRRMSMYPVQADGLSDVEETSRERIYDQGSSSATMTASQDRKKESNNRTQDSPVRNADYISRDFASPVHRGRSYNADNTPAVYPQIPGSEFSPIPPDFMARPSAHYPEVPSTYYGPRPSPGLFPSPYAPDGPLQMHMPRHGHNAVPRRNERSRGDSKRPRRPKRPLEPPPLPVASFQTAGSIEPRVPDWEKQKLTPAYYYPTWGQGDYFYGPGYGGGRNMKVPSG